MITVFTGDDRVRAEQAIKTLLGTDYEVIDCANLSKNDLPQIFKGATIFASHRRILLRDFTANSAIYPEITKYLDTPHEIVLLETKLDKRTATFKEIKDQVEIKDFTLPPTTDFRQVFSIYDTAKVSGEKAIKMLEKIKPAEDPIRFTGLLVSQALKDYQRKQGTKEKQILKSLAILDLQMKSSKIDPWLLVESFLLKLSRLS